MRGQKRMILGGLVVGIVGVVVAKLLNSQNDKQERRQVTSSTKNKLATLASEKTVVNEQEFVASKSNLAEMVTARHDEASDIIKDSLATVSANEKKIATFEENAQNDVVKSDNKKDFDDIFSKLKGL